MSSALDERNEEWIANKIKLPRLSPDGTSSESLNGKDELETDAIGANPERIDNTEPHNTQTPPLNSAPSLPPLPDLIPIRKANLSIPSHSTNVQISAVNADEIETSSQQSKDAVALGPVDQVNGAIVEANEPLQIKEETAEISTNQSELPPAVEQQLQSTDDNQLVASAESNASNNNTNITAPSDQPSAMQDLQPDQPMVQHRKSDRRRVGRDIFFFFEEHPANRRKGRQAKRTPQKRGRPRANRSQPPPRLQLQTKREALTSPELTTPEAESTPTTPRVNPIFLWVKQDDTRIVEVRCEDYDKRNRIRLTKTANGWRAIPRTDPTSSRVVKLLPNPMVHVKQEPRPDLLQSTSTESDSSKAAEFAATNQEEQEHIKTKKNKKKKKKKKKREHDREREEEEEEAHAEEKKDKESPAAVSMDPLSEIPKMLSPAPADIVIYESTNHERNDSEQDEPMETNHSEIPNNGTPLMEPNNNESTVDLTKNITQISDDIELNMPQFIIRPEEAEPEMILCPETGEFRRVDQMGNQQPTTTVDLTNSEPDLHASFDVDTKHLKELLDNEDLLSHCDNGMTGAELIDSLVKRGCEDNHISEEDQHQIKETICLTDDFENEEEEILMRPEPVEDIISRLGESLTASPKCLSFNEAGEIEGLHGELFQNSSNQSDPFNSRNTLEELSITIKDLEPIPPKTTVEQVPVESAETTIVSPDSCVDELPKDLTCKKVTDSVNLTKAKEHGHTPINHQPPQIQPQRTNSRSSDAIQSPQPSGLPAVPPSPDIVHSNKTKSIFLDQLLNQNSTSPKICSSVTVTPVNVINSSAKVAQQKEPLDLGKHRKSASPTVSCSEEAKQVISSDEPVHKRIKTEPVSSNDPKEANVNGELANLLQPAKDPDPLTQLRLLVSNPEWKVPDPILVPKDRLSAVLASPAREIPLLLTTRPELRLPEAFAYPSILQDPDILVISMAQLEAILQKQVEVARPKVVPQPQVTIEPVPRPRQEKAVQQHEVDNRSKQGNLLNPLTPLMAPALANDIDAATLAAFNQMFWLPYLSQMAPDLFKAMAGLPNSANLAELLPFLAQQQQQQQQQQKLQHQQQHQQRNLYNSQFNANAMPFQNPLELAMWQEALNQAQMQQALKLQRESQQTHKKSTTPAEPKANSVAATLFAQKQQQQQQQKHRTNYGMNPFNRMPNRQANANSRTEAAQFLSPNTKSSKQSQQSHQSHQHAPLSNHHSNSHNDQKPRVTLKSLSNLLEPERLLNQTDPKMSVNNLMAMPGFDFTQNQQLAHQQQPQFPQFGHTAGSAGQLHQQQHSQQHQQQQHSQPQQQQQQQQMQGKLKVKPGAHLLDPAAVHRRLLNYEEPSEVGSTTNGLEDMINDPNAPLWHPLFTSNQKTGYTSPWQWTTVTATGE